MDNYLEAYKYNTNTGSDRNVASAKKYLTLRRIFDGFMKVYIEDIDDENEDGEIKLPELNIKDSINIKSLISEQHFTQPPARYTEASLVKKLEELGIICFSEKLKYEIISFDIVM